MKKSPAQRGAVKNYRKNFHHANHKNNRARYQKIYLLKPVYNGIVFN